MASDTFLGPKNITWKSSLHGHMHNNKFASWPHAWFGDKTTWRMKACQYFFTLDLIPSNASPKCVTTVPQSACSPVSTVLFYAQAAKFMWAQICVQHVETAWVAIRSAWESLKNSSSAKITTSSECSTQSFMLVFCVWIIVIASGVIVLGWLTLRDRLFALFSDLPVWYFSDALRQS